MEKIDLTKGKVLKVLTALTLPIIGSSILQFTYNLVDMLWVGRLGSNAVASIGSSSFFIGLGYSISALVVTGTGIKVAHAIGKKNEDEIKAYINAGLILNTVIALIYALSLIFIGKNLIGILNLDNAIVEKDAYLYLAVSGPMMFFSFFNILYIRILNSFGNNKSALKISAIGIIINIILDPIFIYGFKWGVTGAAVTTLISNLFMFIMFHLKFNNMFKINLKDGIDYNKIKEIARLGLPMSFQRVLFTLVNIALARLIAKFGAEAIAAQKIGLQIESVVYMVIGGLNGAISSFVGQNFGAKKYKRINEGYNTALIIGIIYASITTVIFIFTPELLVKIFIREESTIVMASNYLRIIGVSQIFCTIEMISNGMFTGLGMPKIPAIISIVFTLIRIPLALVLTRYLGISGIWWSISISSICKGVLVYLIYKLKIWKDDENVTCS
ncbi:MATE family efflux transporter [Clostridium gasigenes]|uniref:MATE family efflux transporter n=1 Tax=Clostridium gasigenes TaxID=94869 RepID=UPI00143866B7|nr:MATE family efflux transporter [Clostridium gasigenes]MBU3131159.1 MATE family efflux transporter [Clostridium gasigenes]NKF08626.1 MATE family efflux transporter [Clostridium gasigenes]QSW18414.1 MATE family efflux transporter [Clostridium gasigenes]